VPASWVFPNRTRPALPSGSVASRAVMRARRLAVSGYRMRPVVECHRGRSLGLPGSDAASHALDGCRLMTLSKCAQLAPLALITTRTSSCHAFNGHSIAARATPRLCSKTRQLQNLAECHLCVKVCTQHQRKATSAAGGACSTELCTTTHTDERRHARAAASAQFAAKRSTTVNDLAISSSRGRILSQRRSLAPVTSV